jgi:hypothetical protein
LQAVSVQQQIGQMHHVVYDPLGIRGQIGFDRCPVHDPALCIYQTGGRVGAAQVDSDSVHKVTSYS